MIHECQPRAERLCFVGAGAPANAYLFGFICPLHRTCESLKHPSSLSHVVEVDLFGWARNWWMIEDTGCSGFPPTVAGIESGTQPADIRRWSHSRLSSHLELEA